MTAPPIPSAIVAGTRAAASTAASLSAGPVRVSVAVGTSSGAVVGGQLVNAPSYGASVTKVLLLIAALEAAGTGPLSATTSGELAAMIQASDNASADAIWASLPEPATDVIRAASQGGMTGFRLDTSDPVYVLGQSTVTAAGLARLFAGIERQLVPAHRAFALRLLATPDADQQDGIRLAGLGGPIYAKEGWKPESTGMRGAPYVVTQAAQFRYQGRPYGVAVLVQGIEDKASGDAVAQRVAGALARQLDG